MNPITWYNNLRMSFKLGIGFGLVVIIFLGATWQASRTIQQLQIEYNHLLNVVEKEKSLLFEINTTLLKTRGFEKDFIADKKLAIAEQAIRQTNKIKQQLVELEQTEKPAEQRWLQM